MSIIVSDTSAISNLGLVGAARLLPELYGRIIVPTAVWRELMRGAQLHERLHFLRDAEWLEVQSPQRGNLLDSFRQEVHEGEAEAVALALELKADLLLVDDGEGRMLAQRHGVRIMGLLGVLLRAKERGLIQTVAEWIEELRQHTSFRMSDRLIRRVLSEAGELP